MPDIVSSENSIMLINDFKVKWFSLVSRIDAAPTIDEMVLTSFNCIASLLINNRPHLPGYDLLFDVAIKLGVFESVFRWNFNFCGDDLQEYRAKELQFYDSLITSEGSYYLRYPEFTIPLVATLHLCSVRSCLLVERVLVRTLNTVCAALSCQPVRLKTFAPANGLDDEQATAECNYDQISASSRFMFRRLCMGLLDCPSLSGDMEQYSESECYLDAIPGQGYEKAGTHSPEWILPLSVNPKPPRNCRPDQLQITGAGGAALSFRPRVIDSLFDLLVPFVYREGDLGWQARDSLLLLAAYSIGDDEFSRNVVQHSTLCQVLATGLSTFYANLPHRLAKGNQPSQWPRVMISLEECELRSWEFAHFFDAFQFCRSVLEVSHPLIQTSLLYYIHSCFFELVIGRSLVQSNVEEVITATIYLERLLSLSVGSAILPTLLRFLISPLPTENDMTRGVDVADRHTNETSVPNGNDAAGDECSKKALPNIAQSHGYMDLLISRLHCCNTLLGIATLSLFNTILGLNCEDMMVYLVLRYLVPFRDKLLSIGFSWPDADAFRKASEFFTKLTQANGLTGTDCAAATTVAQAPSSTSTSALQAASVPSNANGLAGTSWHTDKGMADSQLSLESRCSVAELDVDDDTGSWTNASSVDPLADGSNNDSRSSVNYSKASKAVKNAPGHHPMETLMPVPLASNGSVVMTGIPAPYSPEFNDSHLHLHDRHPRNNNANKNSSNLVNGVPDKACESPPPPPASQDDWLAYAAWARAAVESRQTACANWRLAFDQHRPMAHQLAAHDLLANLSWGDEPAVDRGQQTPADPDGGDDDDEEVEEAEAEKRFTNGEDMGYIDTEFYEEGERLVDTRMVDTVASFVETTAELNSEEEFRLPRAEHDRNSSEINIANDSRNKGESRLGEFRSPLSRSATEDNPLSPHRQPSVSQKRRQSRRSRSICDSANDLDPVLEADVGSGMRCFSDTNQVKSWYCLSYIDSDLGDVNMEVVNDSTAMEIPPRCANLRLSSSSRTPTHGKLLRSISLSDSAVQNVISHSHRNELDLFVSSLCNIECPVDDVQDKDGLKTVDYDQYFDVFMNESESRTRPTDASVLPDNQATQISLKSGSQWSDVDLYQNNLSGKDTDDSCAEVSHLEPVDSPPSESQHLWLINNFLSGPEYSLAGGENVAAVRSAEVFLERLVRRSLGEASESQKCSPVPTAQIDCAMETVVFPDLGPFLTTLLSRIEGMSHNCFYANLYLTNLLSHLVAYPVPLLRAILLLVPSAAAASAHCSPAPTLTPGVEVDGLTGAGEPGFTAKCLKEASGQLLQTALGSVRQTLDRYAAQLARQPDLGLPSFRDLVLDARRYFRNSAELESRAAAGSSDQSYSMLNQARAGSLIQEQRASAQHVKNNKQRLSILRRLFKRIWPQQSATSKKEAPSSVNSKDEKVHVSSFQIHHMLHNQLSIHESWSQFKWLPEVSEADIPSRLKKRLSFSKTIKKGQRKNSGSITIASGSRRGSATLTPPTEEFSINWPTTQRMVLCAVVLEEFSKELSALSMEHSLRCC